MEYETITDLDALTPDQYDGYVDWLKENTAAELRKAAGVPGEVQGAIGRYLGRCSRCSITRGEFTDFFCVDDPSILDMAGYSAEQADGAIAVLESEGAGVK